MLDAETMSQMDKATELLKPFLWVRDGMAVRQIRQARTAEELIDLLSQSGGLDPVWYERMGEFGPELLPLISKRLRTAKDIRDEDRQEITHDMLIGALRWRGAAGAQVLLERFDDLSDYGRVLASLLSKRQYFYELFGFLSLAGDTRAIVPLLVMGGTLCGRCFDQDITRSLVSRSISDFFASLASALWDEISFWKG
jgi:hypothetical protein